MALTKIKYILFVVCFTLFNFKANAQSNNCDIDFTKLFADNQKGIYMFGENHSVPQIKYYLNIINDFSEVQDTLIVYLEVPRSSQILIDKILLERDTSYLDDLTSIYDGKKREIESIVRYAYYYNLIGFKKIYIYAIDYPYFPSQVFSTIWSLGMGKKFKPKIKSKYEKQVFSFKLKLKYKDETVKKYVESVSNLINEKNFDVSMFLDCNNKDYFKLVEYLNQYYVGNVKVKRVKNITMEYFKEREKHIISYFNEVLLSTNKYTGVAFFGMNHVLKLNDDTTYSFSPNLCQGLIKLNYNVISAIYKYDNAIISKYDKIKYNDKYFKSTFKSEELHKELDSIPKENCDVYKMKNNNYFDYVIIAN
jgi:hypothetical protein